MNSKFSLIVLLLVLAVGLWSCEDLAPGEDLPPGSVTNPIVRGTVTDLTSGAAVQNATVYLSFPERTDSIITGADGSFTFSVDRTQVSSNAVLTIRKPGYELRSLTFDVVRDTSVSVPIRVDLSASALVMGTVRDSATLYPLRNATVILTLPGVVDQFETGVDGSFRLYADLVDRDSLPVTLTALKSGFKTRTMTFIVRRGQTRNLGDVILQVDAGSNVAQVIGHVFDNQNQTVNNALVVLSTPIFTDSMLTSGDGTFSFAINLQGLSGVSGTVSVSKNGYRPSSFSFDVDAAEVFSRNVVIVRDTTTGVPRDSAGTGFAHSIALVSLSNNQISVYGVGGTESAIIIWEARDSLGFPIDIDHQDTISFELIGVPVSGGAYISPSSALTNVSGRVATTINSGTVSGSMQFIATLRRESDGVTIRSTPVIVTVNAGLPDQAHFSIGAARINFPGYDWLGRIDEITVLVGDKYSNPVKNNSAVYFNTTGGVINASGFTNVNGFATVNLYSGNPLPSDPTFGTGFAWIYGSTLGENRQYLKDSILILFSATSQISNVNPTTFAVPRGGVSSPISFQVSDRFGNPLAEGTHISVELQYTPPPNSQINLVALGDIDVTLGDTQAQGSGTTLFSIQVADQTIGGVPSQIPVTVIITVTSPNGNPPRVQLTGTIG